MRKCAFKNLVCQTVLSLVRLSIIEILIFKKLFVNFSSSKNGPRRKEENENFDETKIYNFLDSQDFEIFVVADRDPVRLGRTPLNLKLKNKPHIDVRESRKYFSICRSKLDTF